MNYVRLRLNSINNILRKCKQSLTSLFVNLGHVILSFLILECALDARASNRSSKQNWFLIFPAMSTNLL